MTLFSPNEILVLDGATGTELDRLGVDLSMPLWSARAMDEAPDKLKHVHRLYLDAGAGAIITNTFRTHERSLAKAGFGAESRRLTRSAVSIAREAIQESPSSALLLGSVAPLEDCYSPELSPDFDTSHEEHGRLMSDLVAGGVDCILIETMCTAHESLAAAKAAAEVSPGRWGISFCLDSAAGPGVLQDGGKLADLLPELMEASFIGINCVSATSMGSQIRHLRSCLPETMPIMAYGNVGYADEEGGWVSTDAIEPQRYARYAMEWIESGANIVGGCCGTTPATIAAIREALDDQVADVPKSWLQ